MEVTLRSVSAGALIALGTSLIAAPVWASAGNADNITFCHATASQTNPYVVITTDPKTFFQQGHDGHDGPAWTVDGAVDHGKWGDIVPSFHYSYAQGQQTLTGDYPGKNWTSEGQTILQAGCQQPAPVTPTPTPTDSATPSPSATTTDSASPTPTATPTDSPTGSPSTAPTNSPTPDTSESASPDPTDRSHSPSPSPSTTASSVPTPSQTTTTNPVASPTPSTSVLGTKVTRPPSDLPDVRTATRLPHTGLPMWPLTTVGLALVGMGVALLRRARPA